VRFALWLGISIFVLGHSTSVFAMGKKTGLPDFSSSVPISIQNQVVQDLKFIYAYPEYPGAGPLHQELFGTISGKNYEKFFSDHINTIDSGDCAGGKGVMACALGVFGIFKRMWLTSSYGVGSQPQVYRISILFHEARHTESVNNNWSHISCVELQKDVRNRVYGSHNLYGQEACDDVSRGSYGLQVVLMSNLAANCKDCSSKFKMDALWNAGHYLERVIDSHARQELYDEMDPLGIVIP